MAGLRNYRRYGFIRSVFGTGNEEALQLATLVSNEGVRVIESSTSDGRGAGEGLQYDTVKARIISTSP